MVFTWESPNSDAGSTVTLNLAPSAAGGTDVEHLHVKFPSEESRNNHEAGWGAILATLDGVLAYSLT
nr:SRPBCC domain-containing protein [Abyssibius alkaniclasticus]